MARPRETAGSTARDSASTPPFADPGRTTRARIRDAAIARFGAEGVGTATLTAIAEDAGVSPQLVVHHFDSKDGLAAACDEHVLATIREHKQAAMSAGTSFDPLRALRDAPSEAPLFTYLARRLVDDSPQVARLVDEAVEDALAYSEEGVRSGILKPLALSREHATVLMLWSLGAIVLHHHAERLLGIDLLSGDPRELLAWMVPASEILAEGVFTQEAVEQLRAAASASPTSSPDQTRT